MAQAELADDRRRRELADSLEYAAQVARDPEIARRLAEARAELASGEVDQANLIPYEDLLERLRGRDPAAGES